MPQKAIKFTGINRKVNEFNCSGECEELINLRPDILGGHQVIRPKHITHPSVPYVQIYEHTFGNTYNQIAISENGSVLWINPEDGKIITITDKFDSSDIELSSAGNVLVAYHESDKKQLVYKFEDKEYKDFGLSIPKILEASISYNTDKVSNSAVADANITASYEDALSKAASGFYNQCPNGLCGAAVIGCAYELEDESEIWSTAFIVAISDDVPTINTEDLSVTVTGVRTVTLKLTLDETIPDNVSKINIYASRPVFPYSVKYTEKYTEHGDSYFTHEIVRLGLDTTNLDGQIMFYQGSVIPDKTEINYLINFSASQAGEAVMNVNAGCIERIGNTIAYNNRFHTYRSDVNHVIQTPTASYKGDDRSGLPIWIPFVNIEGKWEKVPRVLRFSSDTKNNFVYPMAGIKSMAFVKYSDIITPYNEMFYVDLKDSSAYNYSYAFDHTPTLVTTEGDFFNEIDESGQRFWETYNSSVFWKKESNAINVSAPYNPFVFPVEYSYSFSGEILDIATSYLPISSTQVGQYPLTIFTSNGVFALEQGNGAVLYSNIVPLQPLVIDGNAAATPYGTFFISSKNLYVLSGREIANASYVLNGERETALRELDSYKALCCNKKGIFFDFTPLLSSKDFEDFISGAVLTYDQLNNELMISSTDPQTCYSYVFNLDTKAYHKIARRYLKSQNGGRYAIEVTGDTKNVVDLQKEERSDNQPVLIQSRPMPIEAFYSHIQRLILLVDAKLTKENQNLCLSVFGSDNLHDWKCIISSQKHDTILRQIRTNRSAKSYKDYVFLITGTVDTDTNISELIADYTAVTRRLG